MKWSATPAPVMNHLWPWITQLSPFFSARVRIMPGSEPPPGAGSVIAKAERTLPSTIGRSHLSFCAVVPTSASRFMLPSSGAAQLNATGPKIERFASSYIAAQPTMGSPMPPKDFGGMGLPIVGWAAMYEEANRSIFGPVAFNCAAPDDGNMNLLARVGTPAQKDKWLKPIVEGKVRSSFAMTEPAPGGGSDPGMIRTRAEKKGDNWVIHGHKWFITGAGVAGHFILVARTSDEERHGLTAFLYHRDQPGWRILRRIPIMGPEEHGGHCELVFEGLEVPDENVLMKVGDGLRVTQIRLGPARLTHCMRWLGLAKRAMEIAQAYVAQREGFGVRLGDRESVQINLGEVAQQIQIGRLLVMHAAWKLDQGDHARKEVSMAKVHVDGASEVHNMVLARFMREEGRDFWRWSAGNRV